MEVAMPHISPTAKGLLEDSKSLAFWLVCGRTLFDPNLLLFALVTCSNVFTIRVCTLLLHVGSFHDRFGQTLPCTPHTPQLHYL